MMSVLHVLDHSLPEQSGYAFRSHAILRELASLGVDVMALTGPKQGPTEESSAEIDTIRYRRTQVTDRALTSGLLGQIRTIWRTRAEVSRFLQNSSSQVIHAHSPCLNALAVLGLGKPLLYEMRSSWEDAAVASGTTTEGSLRYRISRALETLVVREADEVVVICDGLKAELILRGVAEDRITVVPNAVPAEMFALPSTTRTAEVRKRYGLEHARVIGFFGSFFEWEGIDVLIEAMPAVLAVVPDVRLLLAGGGRQEDELRRIVDQYGLANHVIFAGRIAPDDMRAYYGAADVMAYPRVSDRLTEMVTPLKPLEAMAQGRPVVASDVGGHRELITDGETGFLFRSGDTDGLARCLIDVLESTHDLDRVTVAAREGVERERRWPVIAERYLPVYERLGLEPRNRCAQRSAAGS